MKTKHPSIYRGSILHFLSDPAIETKGSYEYFEDGILVVDEGKIIALGEAEPMLAELDHPAKMCDYSGYLIMPGFIDPHVHYTQCELIASYGDSLLDWLNHYTFPTEQRFKDPRHALTIADFFLEELLRNGTTSAMVFASVHKTSVDAFFQAAQERNMRMLCGKVMMDRNAPEYLCDTAESSYDDSLELIERWHGKGRQHYAVTPRFAITSSEAQLKIAGKLLQARPDLRLQTHLAETQDECALVASLFPSAKDYLDVYDQYGLLGKNSLFAHGIHLSERELERLSASESALAYCPSSNLFLGSGALNIKALDEHKIRFGIATDVGAGTSLSMLKTLAEGYKLSQGLNIPLSALRAFYLATRGNAEILGLEDRVGSFQANNEADFIVLDLQANPLQELRIASCASLAERLFVLMMLGDDRNIHRTYIAGKLAHKRQN